MVFRKPLFTLAALFISALSNNAFAERVEFKTPVKLRAIAGQRTTIVLTSLLTFDPGDQLDWGTPANPHGAKPPWLTLDGTLDQKQMFIDPPAGAVGVFRFGLSFRPRVVDGGGFEAAELTVYTQPKWLVAEIDLGTITEGTNISSVFPTLDLPSLVAPDSSGQNQTFTFEDPNGTFPRWMTVGSNGTLTGTPARADVKEYRDFFFVVNTQSGGTARVPARVTVKKVFKGPKWVVNPTVLPNVDEDVPYSRTVVGPTFVTYTEPEPLTYKKIAGGKNDAWVELTAAGEVKGTPARAHVGPVEIKAEVSATYEGVVYKDETVLKFNVNRVNKPPAWKTPVVDLPDAYTRLVYAPQNLTGQVTDPDPGTVFSFKVLAHTGPGTDWAKVSTAGMLDGTPANANLGAHEWTVEVSDGALTATAKIRITVKNRPPTWIAKPTILKPNATEDVLFKAALTPYARDPENDPLLFTKMSGPAWASINANGELEGTPRRTDVMAGVQKFVIRVADALSGGFDDAEVQLTIDKVNKPPEWTMDPITLPDAPERVAYDQSLASFATDPDPEDLPLLVFTKVSGPAWASIDAKGRVTGTPKRADVGKGTFVVEVKDPKGLKATAAVLITVLKVNQIPLCANPGVLKDAFQDAAYAFDLLAPPPLASDADGDKLTFKPIALPSWMTSTADGKLSGKPVETDIITAYAAEWEVTDPDGAKCKLVANGKVLRSNWTPEVTTPVDITVKERTIRDFNFRTLGHVKDQDVSDTLTCTPIDMANWVAMSNACVVTLRPLFANISPPVHTFRYTVTDGKSAPVAGVFRVTVERDPRPPIWLENPIRFEALAGTLFTGDISKKAQDLDGLPITFSLNPGGPAWLTMNQKGELTGTPAESDVGDNFFKVTVKNDLREAVADLIIKVKSSNRPPKWMNDPIVLPDAYVGENYSNSLSTYAMDPDVNDALKFERLTTSTWLFVTVNGLVIGTPEANHVGLNKIPVRVKDPKGAFADATVHITVRNQDQDPKWKEDPINLGEAPINKVFTFDLRTKVTDPNDGPQPISFRKATAAPNWMVVSSQGIVSGTPLETHLGAYTTLFEVTDDGIIWIPVNAYGKVTKPESKIAWKEDPIRFTTVVNKPFSATLVDRVNNPDNATLTFTKGSGPTWLTVAQNGQISGTPPKVNEDFFSVTVAATGGALPATLIINVINDKPDEDSFDIGDPVPGARADNLWIVDNDRDPCSGESCFIAFLRDNIKLYYDALDRAEIHHYGVYLSADACSYRHIISDSKGRKLLSYNDSDWTASFHSRISRSPNQLWPSPLTAFWQLHYRLMGSVPSPFFEEKVPMDALILSPRGDQYSPYVTHGDSYWRPISGWNPARFLSYVQAEHKSATKNLRVSALAVGGSSAYQTMTSGTKGKYYVYKQDGFGDSLRDYAEDVIFRAYVMAKQTIKLSKVPTDISSIKVTLAGELLTSDKWRYLAATNEVEIFWRLIDISSHKPGDRLVVTYK